jgi:hypothetical protein
MAKRNGGPYASEKHLINQMSGVMSGLSSMLQAPQPYPLQQGRLLPGGGTVDGKQVCECAINPTHCFRTVSQRSLSTPTRFVSTQEGVPNITAGTDIFAELFTNIGGAVFLFPGETEKFFNDADVQKDRQRVYDLVLIAIRSEVNVQLMDAEPVAAGAINVSTLQSRLEELALSLIDLKVYHSADRNDPWIDKTNLGYFSRPRGEYVMVPPVMWVDRDPVMSLQMGVPEFTGGAANTSAYVGLKNSVRDLEGIAEITVECLYIPDPYTCPDLWPGQICPRDMVGNTPDYRGKIASAVRKLTGSK